MADDVTVEGVCKAFGTRRVLGGVDLHLPAGAVTAVLGPSGCGKTTLLRIVAGFTAADAGTVTVGDRPVTQLPPHRRRIGLLPQEGALFPYLSVGENVAFGLGRDGRRARVEHWLELVGLAGMRDARPHELSGGQQQRVALARALAPEPSIVLLDEPFSALDSGLRTRVREEVADILTACGTTAMLVTHDQGEALSLADRVALLLDGVVAQNDVPTEVYRRPATLAAARVVGATVELAGRRDGATVTCALGRLPAAGPAPDGPVTAVLRPEQVRASSPGAATVGATATVRAVRFHGTHLAVRVGLADGTDVALQVPPDAGYAVGAPITVAVGGAALTYAAH